MQNENIMLLIKKLTISIDTWNRNHMNQVDLTPVQALLLMELLERKEDRNYSSELSKSTGFSRGTISSNLKALRKKGYITMNDLEEDNRKKEITLTDKAIKAENITKQLEAQAQKHLCDGIQENEILFLEKILTQMIQNLKQDKEDLHDKEVTRPIGVI